MVEDADKPIECIRDTRTPALTARQLESLLERRSKQQKRSPFPVPKSRRRQYVKIRAKARDSLRVVHDAAVRTHSRVEVAEIIVPTPQCSTTAIEADSQHTPVDIIEISDSEDDEN